MSSTLLLPPRAQLCNRSCSNKTHTLPSKIPPTLIINVSLRHEFHGVCANPARNGEASHADANGALDAAVKSKLDNYQHDYNERNFFFLPAVMMTSG